MNKTTGLILLAGAAAAAYFLLKKTPPVSASQPNVIVAPSSPPIITPVIVPPVVIVEQPPVTITQTKYETLYQQYSPITVAPMETTVTAPTTGTTPIVSDRSDDAFTEGFMFTGNGNGRKEETLALGGAWF